MAHYNSAVIIGYHKAYYTNPTCLLLMYRKGLSRQKYMMPVRRSWNLVHLQHLVSDQPLIIRYVQKGIIPAKIYDAGKTQLESSTFTALGIGPAPIYKIDPLIKDLK